MLWQEHSTSKKTKIVSTAFVLDVKMSVLIKDWENRY